MTIINVYEDCHGLICTAATLEDAIDYLLTFRWIDDTTEVWDDTNQKLVNIKEYLGSDWENVLRSISIDLFNDIFEDNFGLALNEVYERKR